MAEEKDDKKKKKEVDPLLIEIQEDMKRERWENFFKKYGSFLAVIAIILLAIFGGNEFYQHQKLQRQKASGEILYSIVGGESIENPI